MPAVPEPLDGRSRLRRRRRALRNRRGRGELQLHRLGPGRQPAQPVRRSARHGGLGAVPADRRGWSAAEPGSADDNRSVHRRSDHTGRIGHPNRPRHGRGAAGQPERVQPRPECPPHRRVRVPEPVPLHRPAGHERAVDRRRRLEHVGGDQPCAVAHRWRPEHGLALLRGRRQAERLRRREPEHLREPLRGGRRGDASVLRLQPLGQGRRERGVPDRELVDRRPGLLRRRVVPGGVRECAVLHRLLAELHLGDVRRRERPAESGDDLDLRIGRCRPGRPPDRPRRRPLLRRPQRRHDPPHQLLLGQPAADGAHHGDAHERRGAAHRELRRHRLVRPEPRRPAHVLVGSRRRRRHSATRRRRPRGSRTRHPAATRCVSA